MNIRHPDPGTIHAYVEGQLPFAEQQSMAAHLESCTRCVAAVAEARGFIAAASRIVGALDDVPAGVAPAREPGRATPGRRAWRVSRVTAAAAALLLVAGVSSLMIRAGDEEPGRSASPERASMVAEELVHQPARSAADAAPARTAATTVAEAGTAAPEVRRERRAEAAGPPEGIRFQAAAPPPAAPPPAARPPAAPPPAAQPSSPPHAGTTVADLSVAGRAGGEVAARTRSTAQPTAAPASALSLRSAERVPLRIMRYDAGNGVVVELREYVAADLRDAAPRAAPAAPVVATEQALANQYRWTDPAGTRVYVLSGPFPIAELEELARRLAELPVVR